MSSEKVFEDGEIGHRSVHHLYEMVIGELGSYEIAAPELIFVQTAVSLVQFLLDIAYGTVHRERHAVARNDWVVDDIGIRELFVHHVERFDDLYEDYFFFNTPCKCGVRGLRAAVETHQVVPSTHVGVLRDVLHVYFRMWDARWARLRRCVRI